MIELVPVCDVVTEPVAVPLEVAELVGQLDTLADGVVEGVDESLPVLDGLAPSVTDADGVRESERERLGVELGVSEEEVTNMNRRLGGDASLNAPLRADGESEWQDWLADDTAVSQETHLAESEEKSIRMGLLQEAMEELTDREKHILTERRLKDDPVTLEELAGQYGVSRERVRQIEVRAFEKLQKAMRAAAEERNLVDA